MHEMAYEVEEVRQRVAVVIVMFLFVPLSLKASVSTPAAVRAEAALEMRGPTTTLAVEGNQFPSISRNQTRPVRGRAQTNSPCNTSCNCRFDCRIAGGLDKCTEAPAANCKYLDTSCESCATCVCW